MVQENITQEFKLKNIDEEIKQNELMNRNQKKFCTTLNYIEHFLILASTITACISVPTFASLLGILIGTVSLAIGLKICAITARIKKRKSQ